LSVLKSELQIFNHNNKNCFQLQQQKLLSNGRLGEETFPCLTVCSSSSNHIFCLEHDYKFLQTYVALVCDTTFCCFHGFMEYHSTNGSFKTQDMSLNQLINFEDFHVDILKHSKMILHFPAS